MLGRQSPRDRAVSQERNRQLVMDNASFKSSLNYNYDKVSVVSNERYLQLHQRSAHGSMDAGHEAAADYVGGQSMPPHLAGLDTHHSNKNAASSPVKSIKSYVSVKSHKSRHDELLPPHSAGANQSRKLSHISSLVPPEDRKDSILRPHERQLAE